MNEVSLSVNGRVHKVAVPGDESLLETLRGRFGLRGTKDGCQIGYCGACTVILDGSAVHSCCVLTAAQDGSKILTIESDDSLVEMVAECFAGAGALQCGYCTPGFVMSVRQLCREKVQWDPDSVADYLNGNMCRCTGYTKILEAARAALEASS